jgi:hypothetical protein
MGKIKLIVFFLSIYLSNSYIKAQNIDSALTNFYQQSSFEKAYVQFDNNRYAAGQTIWYKAYLLNGFEPSVISKNFYLDWYDDHGKLISSNISPINYCYSSGNFNVPEKYAGKFIQAIAYTKWMRNFDSAYFFKQRFPIISTTNNTEIVLNSLPETTVQFLPESGNLILNKQNIIAFKAVNQSGLPESIQGIIKNKMGDSITSFKSIHDGMGKFIFLPIPNENYIAEWKDIPGIVHQTKLPEAISEGINLIIESGNTNRVFHIQRTNTAPISMKKIVLVGQMNGKVLFKANINLTEKESITSTLPISKINSGILQLTVFDANKIPLCERLLFVKNKDYLINAVIKADTINTIKRGKNVIEIELEDSSYANFSLAITDADLSSATENTIASQLLLQGDLTGHIYKQAYYFGSNADSVSDHLDLVMLTNGWRRFKWNTILNDPLPNLPFTKDSAYQTLIGKVDGLSIKNNKPPSINLILSAKDSSEFLLTVPIQNDGSFSAKNVVLYDTSKIFYNLNDKTLSSNTKVRIENDFYKVDPKIMMRSDEIKIDTIGLDQYIKLIEEQKRVALLKQKTTLKEVTVYAKEKTRIKQLDLKYTKGLFSIETKNSFDMNSLQNASHTQSIFDFLTGRVPGLNIGNTQGGTASENVVQFRGGEVSFYLNEIFIPTSQLQNIDVSSIAYIKFFDPPFAGGVNEKSVSSPGGGIKMPVIASSAAIGIYTKIGGDLTPEKSKYNTSGMGYQMQAGYAPMKEFYNPNYAEREQQNASPDLRSSLFWDPWINLDKNHKKTVIRFYNNDITHSYRLILEGMDSKGKLLHISKILK